MTRVSVLTCKKYDKTLIKNILITHLKNIGLKPDELKNKKVGLKPNFLYATAPEKAIITHPVFFQAVSEIIKENGGKLFIIESPALDSLQRALKVGGYLDTINDLSITVPEKIRTTVLFYEKNRQFKRFEVVKEFADMDILINLPKLKTHGLTTITCAVKNLFGIIPGLQKSLWHQRARSKEEFSRFLLEFNNALLYGCSRPKTFVHLVDGITGLEGSGPGAAGTPRDYGITIAGTNAVAVDYVAGTFLGIKREEVKTTDYGLENGFNGISSPEAISLSGENIHAIALHDVKLPGSSLTTDTFNKWPMNTPFIKNIMLRLLSKKPVPLPSKCILCYKCKQICPVNAIDHARKNKNVPHFNYNVCIRCFCCHEICPESAITLK